MRRSLLAFLALLLALPASAQLVAGPWVDRAEARIDAHRKGPLEIRVLDAEDRPVAGARVRVLQLRHAFPFGVVLPAERGGWLTRVGDPARPVWRGLSAVSLEAFSSWQRLQPVGPEVAARPGLAIGAAQGLDQLLDLAAERGLFVRVASAAPGDPADRPDWAVGLSPERRALEVERFLEDLLQMGAGRFHAVDLASAVSDHPWLTTAELRRLGQRARVSAAPVAAGGTRPPLWLGVGLREALALDRGGRVLPAAEGLMRAFVPVDGVSTPLRLREAIEPADLERSLQRLDLFGVDAAIAPLEMVLPEADQPFALEAALVLLFAEPRVREIHLGGVEPGGLESLFDEAGQPTDGGHSVDHLLAERWWTNAEATTDALGVARLRVFAGRHAVTAGGPAVEVAVPAGEVPTEAVVEAGR